MFEQSPVLLPCHVQDWPFILNLKAQITGNLTTVNQSTFWQMKPSIDISYTVLCLPGLNYPPLPAPCSPLPCPPPNCLRLSLCRKIEFPCNRTATVAAAAATAAAPVRRREERKSLNKARWRTEEKTHRLGKKGPKQLEGKLNQCVVKKHTITKQYVFSFS